MIRGNKQRARVSDVSGALPVFLTESYREVRVSRRTR
jgi:hypothetical protein